MHSILVACNGFPFYFIFVMAEVKCCKLDKVFNSTALYLAGMLYSDKRGKLQFMCTICIYITV